MKYDGRQNATKQTLTVNVEWPILGESCHRLFCWRNDTWIEVPADKALRSIDLPSGIIALFELCRLLRYASRMVNVSNLAPQIEPAGLEETVPPDLTFYLGV